jgi:hypothetical protein
MVTTFAAPGPHNGYIPSASGQCINFIRNPEEFPLNKWVTLTPHDQPTGFYSRLDRDNGVRTANIDRYVWADGADLPSGQFFTSRFTVSEFRTQRHAVPWELGAQTVDNADLWNPKLVHMKEATSLLMTLRTKRIYTVAETSGNWSGNTASASTLSGAGKFDVGTSLVPNFAKGMLTAAQRINLGTNAKVRINQLRAIINPIDAIKIGNSPEIRDYLKGSVHARMMLEDPFNSVNALWGLPHYYQGIEIIVDDTPFVTENMNDSSTQEATTARTYAKAEDSIIIVARPGSLDGELSTKSYSTIQIFYYKKVGLMQVKGQYDSWNEKWKGAVIDQTGEYLAAPMSGYFITDCITA